MVLVGVPEDPAGLHCVDLDFPMAARLAVDELAETGHDRLVFVGHAPDDVERDLNYVRRFMDPARAVAERHGLPYELIAPVEPTRAGARAAVERAVASRGDARLGFVVPNSAVLHPLLSTLDARGLLPGRDVSAHRAVHGRRGGRERATGHQRVRGAARRLAARHADLVPPARTDRRGVRHPRSS